MAGLSDEQRAALVRSVRSTEESWARWRVQVAQPVAEVVSARLRRLAGSCSVSWMRGGWRSYGAVAVIDVCVTQACRAG